MAASNLNLGKASGGVLNIQPADGTTNTSLVLPASGTVVATDTAVTDNAIARYDGTTGKVQNSGVIIDDSGNVGIGVSPVAKLDVVGSLIRATSVDISNTQLRTVSGTNSAIYCNFGTRHDNTAHYVYGYGSVPLVIATNNTERITVGATGTTTFNGSIVVNGTVTANAFNDVLPTNGLRLYWTFDGATTTVPDASGNGFNGTLSSTSLRTAGKNGNGITMTTSGQSVTSSLVAPAGAKTIAFWVRTSRALSDLDDINIGFQGNSTGNGFMFMFGVGSVQDLGFWGYGAAADYALGSSYSASWVNNGLWNHVAATVNSSGQGLIYFNGALRTQYFNGSTTASNMTLGSTLASNFSIGATGTPNRPVSIDSVVVYDRALSSSEIVDVMNATA